MTAPGSEVAATLRMSTTPATLTLRQYLDSRRTTGTDWNVTGLRGTPDQNNWLGKYSIPDEEYPLFLKLAHDHVFVKGRAHSLLEKHKPQSPILVDLDFRYAAGGPLRRRFTPDQLRDFVAAYADAIARFFDTPTDPEGNPIPLQFFVMTKPAAEVDAAHDQQKDGVHIVCPSITTRPEIQYALRGYLLQTGIIERLFGGTGMTNEPTDCFDKSVVAKNNWFLYGACKPDKAWYKVEAVYTFVVPEVYDSEDPINADYLESEPLDTWTSEELVSLLSIRNGHDEATPLTLRTDDAAAEVEWTQLVQRWGKGDNWAKPKSPGLFGKASGTPAPDTISLEPAAGAATATGGAGTTASATAATDMIQISGMSVRAGYSTEDVALAYKLVRECLNPTRRAREYQDWVNLGLLLHNISATDESCAVWAEISRRVPGFSATPDKTYKDKWALLPAEAAALQRGRKPLMMGTLHLWAKEDSPATYRMILNDANTELAYLNDSGTHVAIADLVVRMYRHEFRCTPGKKGASAASMEWYQFPPDGHTWRSLKTWHRLRERLSSEVRNVYIAADVKVGQREMATVDPSERERLQEKRKKLLKVEQHLQNWSFKEAAMKECAEKFYDEEFLSNMNQDPTLVGFSNGVLELRRTGTDGRAHIHFRDGRPDDCISFQMGRGIVGLDAIPYVPYNPDAPAPEHLEILDFFTKIYPDPALRKYCLTLYPACLEGCNAEQLFWVMTGSGGNGKSKIVDLMSKTFGEYQETLPVTALTRKRADAGSATPEMVPIKNKRFVSMMEPEEGEKINTSLMKQLTGGDVIKARGLFQDQDQFVVMARIFMSCNDLPPVSSMDEGTWRRIRVIPHVAKFVPPGTPTNPAANVHPRDPLLDTKIIRWRPYFAGLLAWYYETYYLAGDLKEPASVAAASNKYKEENDSFVAFNTDCLLREDGAEVRARDILERYREWTRTNPGRKVLDKKDVLARMRETYGAPIDAAGRVFGGVRIAMEGEDISGNLV